MRTPRGSWAIGALGALLITVSAEAAVRVHNVDEVIATRTVRVLTGDLLFRESSGALVRLITSIDDPAITNRGDGTFHPVSQTQVENALSVIPVGFLGALDVDVYLLPFPRATCLRSSADDRAIYLSPGVVGTSLGTEQQTLLTHEVGHLVHRRFLPDADTAGWTRLLALHGVDTDPRYRADAAHAFRPHEVFAEDFRVLFGSDLAKGDGRVENAELGDPRSVWGLRSFFLRLADLDDPAGVADLVPFGPAFTVYPNPLPPGANLFLAQAGAAAPRLALLDLSGRRVSEPRVSRAASGDWEVDLAAQRLSAGAYWLALADGRSTAVPVRILR